MNESQIKEIKSLLKKALKQEEKSTNQLFMLRQKLKAINTAILSREEENLLLRESIIKLSEKIDNYSEVTPLKPNIQAEDTFKIIEDTEFP